MNDLPDPVFLDIEASSLHGLHSYPIEVAWGGAEGAIRSYLINPYAYPEEWTDWDPASQALHGLSRNYLSHNGQHPEYVARAIESELSARVVFSDNPAYDRFWISRLFEALGRESPVEVRALVELLQTLLPSQSFYFDHEMKTFTTLETLYEKARARCGLPAHRAKNDVAYLRMVYILAQEIAS